LDVFTIAVCGVIGAVIAFLVAKFLQAAPLYAALLTATVNALCWIGGYQMLHSSRRWDSVSRRFSGTRGKILLLGVAGAIGLIIVATAVSQILMHSSNNFLAIILFALTHRST
jgi:hypothetical protein